MTNLTITSVCTKGPVYPMILNFQNGYPSEDFECECAIIQDNKGKKTIAAEINRLLYVGVEENENMGQTLLLVRNRTTGEVRLIETEIAELKPIINDSDLQFSQTSNSEVNQTTGNHLQQETANLEMNLPPNYPQQSETNELDTITFLNQPEKLATSEIETDTIPIHSVSDLEPSKMPNHQPQNASVFNSEKCLNHLQLYETNEFESNMLNHDHQKRTSVIDSRILKHPETEHLETREIELSRMPPNCHQKLLSMSLSHPKYVQESALESSIMLADHSQKDTGITESNTILNHQIQLHSNIIRSDQQPETEQNGSPGDEQVTETNKIELNIIENNFEQLIRNKELLQDTLEEKESEIENEGRTTDRIHFIIDIDIERLTSPEPHDHCKQSAPIVDSNNEFDGENNLENKLTQEKHEKQGQFKSKDYSIQQFFVAGLGLYSTGESIEQTEVLYTNNGSNDISTSVRINNDSVTLKQTFTENTYICDHCEAVYDNKGSMIFHIISHNFVKDTDNEVAKSMKKRVNNEDITNNDSVTSKQNVKENNCICDYCESVFENKGSLISHLDSHNFVKYTDNEVAKSMMKRDNNEDMTNNDSAGSKQTVEEKTYICDYCESVLENKASLISHLDSHNFVKDSDNDIAKSMMKRVNNEDMTNNDSGSSKQTVEEKTYICDYCEFVLENKDSLIFHLDSHNFDQNTGNDFEKLMMKIINNEDIANHDSVTPKQTVSYNTYICDHCEALFDNKGSMIFHLISHEFLKNTDNDVAKSIMKIINNDDITNYDLVISNQNVSENNCICDYCESVFENKGSLISHLDSHNFVKDSDNDIAKSMMKRVNNEDMTNNNSASSKQTVEEKTYICDYCESVLENKDSLIFHLDSHSFVQNTGNDFEKSMMEIINNKGITNDDSVASKQTVTDSTYICDHCEALFDNKGSMIFHQISHEFLKNTDNDVANSMMKIINNDYIANNDSVISKQNVKENNCICDYCESVFENKGSLISHLDSHNFAKDIDNDVAKSMIKIINNKDITNDDSVSSKQTDIENTYICDYCESVFEDKCSLIFHLDSHNLAKGTDNDVATSMMKKINTDDLAQNYSVSSKQTLTDSTYICDHCEAVFENKGCLIFHLFSHKYVKEADSYVIKLNRIIGNDNGKDHNNGDGNANSYSEDYTNSKKKNEYFNEKCYDFKDSKDKKRKIIARNGSLNNEQVKRIKTTINETEEEDGAVKIRNNAPTKLINCKHCDYKTDDMSNVMKHILTHTQSKSSKPEESYMCNYCEKKFKSKASLIVHIGNHKENPKEHTCTNPKAQKNLCKNCNSIFATRSDLISHRIKMHDYRKNNKSSTIYDNKNSSVRNDKLSVPTQTLTKRKPFQCDICKYQCHKKCDINEHMKTHTREKPFQCQVCDSRFAKKNALNRHIITHTREKAHECKFCESKFTLLSGLKRHLLIHIGDKPFKCATCSARFNDNSALKRHERSHAGDKTFKCTRCEYSCITNNDLKTHTETHSNMKQKSSDSKEHSGSHTGEKPFQCTFCNAKFVLKNSLNRHTKIHTGEKGLKCTFCESTFIQLSDLKRHLKVHTNDKPVKCTACNTGYSSEKALKWHLKRHRNHK